MAETIKQTETTPESRPALTVTLSEAAAALPAEVVWQRLETWAAHRWGARDVLWIVEGCGEWTPPLAPATVSTVEVWDGTAWAETVPLPSPLGGYELAGDGPYRITASVGAADVPDTVQEAFRRLAEYLSASATDGQPGEESEGFHGVGNLQIDVGDTTWKYERYPTWQARAMTNSGAADLLRPYRRA